MHFKFVPLFICLLLLGACQPYMLKSSAVDQFPLAQQEIQFFDVLEDLPAVTNNDALHGLFLLQDGSDRSKDYEERVTKGIQREWLSASFTAQANAAAHLGWMASAGCRIMKIRGGVSMMLFGPIDRYALKELIYMEILPLRTENQSLSGAEFIDYLNRLERIAGRATLKRGELQLDQTAGQSAVTPANEAAIQEGSMPASGPLEEPLVVPPIENPAAGPIEPEPAPEPVNTVIPKASPSPPTTRISEP